MGKKGLTGTLYQVAVLPATVRELVEAVYNQKYLKQEEALEIADYLDEKYNISPYVPTNSPPLSKDGE